MEELSGNIQKLVRPYFERLKNTRLDRSQLDLLDIIENSLASILPGFSMDGLSALENLTPKEMEVAGLIKMGRSSKKIAELLDISTQTVAFHRKNIRKKLGLEEKSQNLRSRLMKRSGMKSGRPTRKW